MFLASSSDRVWFVAVTHQAELTAVNTNHDADGYQAMEGVSEPANVFHNVVCHFVHAQLLYSVNLNNTPANVR